LSEGRRSHDPVHHVDTSGRFRKSLQRPQAQRQLFRKQIGHRNHSGDMACRNAPVARAPQPIKAQPQRIFAADVASVSCV